MDAAVSDSFAAAAADGKPLLPSPRDATLWHEIRTVLESRELISFADPETVIRREFTALLLELHFFAPEQVGDFFPGLEDPGLLIAAILEQLPARRWHDETRPDGLSNAGAKEPAPDHFSPVGGTTVTLPAPVARGNDVRQAMALAIHTPGGANPHIDSLAARIGEMLALDETDRLRWRVCLREIIAGKTEEGWTTERRILYDLQRACLAIEQELHTADLVEWIATLGAQPVKRRLDKPRWLLVGRHLRAASQRASSLAPAEPFVRLEELLHHGLIHAENAARAELRPVITDVLNEVGLKASTFTEQVSHRQVVEELLDGAWERGYLKIGDLRDSLARSRIKLPDLSGPKEFIVGDPLIRANRLLSVRLDGVYHRGEAYMRLLQRACSLFFGTPIGRMLTLFVALPFGGAFIFLEAIHHMAEAAVGLTNWLTGWNKTVVAFEMVGGTATGYVVEHPKMGHAGFDWLSWLLLGALFFQLIHWKRFRTTFGQYALFLLFTVPHALFHSPFLAMLFNNVLTRFYRRYLLLPTLTGVPTAFLGWLVGLQGWEPCLMGLGFAISTMILVRTTLGRGIEDRFNEVAERAWRVLSVNFVLGAFSLVLSVFNWILEGIDKSVYAVDESLRFRQGQGRLVFVAKLFLGLGWFLFTYVFRFAWNLLVEPQINPIKHFPVVTVSHKMFLPLIPSLAKQFSVNEKTMGLIVSGIPGIFGFLVWELKENWKLYRANAAKVLKPAMVGSHGETMRALLRPGVHSGAVPKTRAKLRRALVEKNQVRVGRHQHHLGHMAESLQRLVERSFLGYLQSSLRWAGRPIHAESPRLAVNRVRFPLCVDHEEPVNISIEERGGWLIASVEHSARLATLTPSQRAAWDDALAGLYKLIGVHLVREQFATLLGSAASGLDASGDGLLVPRDGGAMEFYKHDDGPEWLRTDRRLEQTALILSDHPVNWSDWDACWESDSRGAAGESALPGWRLTGWPV